jgi:hypothetical protein
MLNSFGGDLVTGLMGFRALISGSKESFDSFVWVFLLDQIVFIAAVFQAGEWFGRSFNTLGIPVIQSVICVLVLAFYRVKTKRG